MIFFPPFPYDLPLVPTLEQDVLPACPSYKKIFLIVYGNYRRFHCDISIFHILYVLHPKLVHLPHYSPFFPHSSSYGDFNRFQCPILILTEKVHQLYPPSLFSSFTLLLPCMWSQHDLFYVPVLHCLGVSCSTGIFP
jgi:hypothetical protein